MKMGKTAKDTEAIKGSRKWTSEEVIVLIEIWKDFYDQLCSMANKILICEEMANLMVDKGYEKRSPTDIKIRIRYLTDQYNRVRPRSSDTGKGGDEKPAWIFYSQVHEILGKILS